MNLVLNAKRITKIYGKNKKNETRALNGLDFSLREGEFVGIMGPSGSGKTTLLNILAGIDTPTSGTISVMNDNLENMTKDQLALFRRKRLGFIFQDFNLLNSLNIKENIMLPMVLDRGNIQEMDTRAHELMSFFEIDSLSSKHPYHISGGQKQRAAACRALMNNPSIVLADEPTGNLDSKSSNSIMNTLVKMNKERKCTILMVTHDPFAASFCDRIIFIKDGSIEMEITKKSDRHKMFNEVLDCEAILGGDRR